MFVIISIVIVVVGGFMMIFVIPPLQFKMQTGFITSEEAKNIAHRPEWLATNFVFLKYTTMNVGGCNVMIYSSDPYSKKITGDGRQISLPCFPYGFPGKLEGFAWAIDIDSIQYTICNAIDLVDAKNGEHIGVSGGPCLEQSNRT